jgi:hypothetical protein
MPTKSKKLRAKMQNRTKRNQIKKWIRKSNKKRKATVNTNMKVFLATSGAPADILESWEDDDLEIPTLHIPKEKADEEKATDEFVSDNVEQLQPKETSTTTTTVSLVSSEESKRLAKEYTEKYKKMWLKEHHPLYASMSRYHKSRVDKEFNEYMKKHHKNPLSLQVTFFNMSAGGGENYRFIA